MGAEQIFLNVTIVLVIASIIHFNAKFFKIPDLLLLIITGYVLGNIDYGIFPIIFPQEFVHLLALISIVFLVFTGSTEFNFKIIESHYLHIAKYVFALIFISLIFFTPLLYFITGIPLKLSILISLILTGVSPLVVDSLYLGVKNRVANLLILETRIPSFDAIFAFIIYDLLFTKINIVQDVIIDNVKIFITEIVIGLGTGVFIALITYKLLKIKRLMPALVLLLSALTSFQMSEQLGGSGILAIVSTSLLLGNMKIKNLKEHMQFLDFLTKIIRLLVGIIIGTIIKIPMNANFFISSIFLYLCFLAFRYFTVRIFLSNKLKTARERLGFSFGSGLGFSAVILATLFIQSGVLGASLAVNYITAFLFYSVIIASITAMFVK
ncbi:hypothetical protein COV11_03915 [Candidatus Woesearchaeota archaeon CG10_big_fil_rev_8_21_14_0_10_30_7]|nr:MAG: hypothetical protein COV11_03915 [Candidatus Woesearchaeota archaeon CG10_big_fil_rev_8_21_14_0_10_30_7]